MKLNTLLVSLAVVFSVHPAFALTYTLPKAGGNLVGSNEYEQVPQGQKAPLETYAADII